MTEAHDALLARMAVVESRVAGLADEQRRTRDRLHDVESERFAVKLLSQKVDSLANDVREFGDNVEKAAERAAERAVRLAFEKWEEERERRETSRARIWATRVGWGVLLISAGGFLLAVIQSLRNAPAG